MDDVIFDDDTTDLRLGGSQTLINEISSKIPENYRLAYYVGGGAVGTVLAAKNEKTNFTMAVKAVKTSRDTKMRDNVYKECTLQKGLKHDNIAKVMGSAFTYSYSIIFMELLSGGDLLDIIPMDIGLPVINGFHIYIQILDALEYCHNKEIVHLDIKPENIMISASGKAKLIDFGLAINHKDTPILSHHVGTLSYSAPETFLGREKPYQGYKADLFSLGVTFLTSITGERCWIKATLDDMHYYDWVSREWNANLWRVRLPAEMLCFFLAILAHDPNDRLNIHAIRAHHWYRMALENRIKAVSLPENINGKINSHRSQPQFIMPDSINSFVSFDELPLSQPDTFALMPELKSNKDSWSIVKRMTRFFSKLSLQETYKQMKLLVEQNSWCIMIRCNPNNLMIQSNQSTLSVLFRIFIYRFADSVLVDFRRIRGDGLLFHVVFKQIRNAVSCNNNDHLNMIDEKHPYLRMIIPNNGINS